MDGLFLGIDCGTQGTKALVLDAGSGHVLGLGSAAHQPPQGTGGRREQDPGDWLAALRTAVGGALREAGVSGKAIRGLAVSGQQHGLVLLDAQGQVLRPAKLWCDTQSTPENLELLEALGGAPGSLERLGLVIAPGYTVSKLLWSKRRFPELFERAAHILLPHDYLNHWLTGRACSEPGDASGTGYYDVRRRAWAADVLQLIEPGERLLAALPELVEPGDCIGTLRTQAAELLGLSPQAWVASGGGDNMLGAIGTGNIHPGMITLSLGTSGTLAAHADHPLVTQGEVATFCASSGGWLPLICTMNLTSACGLVQALLQLDREHFAQLAGQAPIGAEGLLMLPFFDGERVPALPDASASLHGMTSNNLTRANLCRAVLEGTCFSLRLGLDLLRASGLPGEEIRLVGGAAKSPLWRQVLADLLGLPVVCPRQTEAATLGAAIQAAWSLGRQQGDGDSLDALCQRCVSLDERTRTVPRPAQQAAYEMAYQRYREHLPGR
ncbi:xylulokinase [Pseudomonas guariconensis]|uniref:xylulokinase n=1 Tax=Pseudomonas TaxID=286 RepID=UPI001CE3CFF7|nr:MULTISPECIES: xylulokinase [Pseudomonas]MCO7515916.1 xylulokinase [Pseudomonas putida]MCO7594357.1 xylulokinase [Pseudomonas guariconensis]MCO7607130.1 xylulokinase [Pseudomonas guariconensis]MCO7633967.1 xylulokinase [Pseudomonas guariconensis]MCU7218696.1 xylulokinase [Pseudomonas brassicacearum]